MVRINEIRSVLFTWALGVVLLLGRCSDIDLCDSHDGEPGKCSSDADCISGTCLTSEGRCSCSISNGFTLDATSQLCTEDVNECECDLHQCDNDTTQCVNTYGSYSCNCLNGYEPDATSSLSCVDIIECKSNLACLNGHCHNTEGSFSCSCNNGYVTNKAKTQCVDKDECDTLCLNETEVCENYEGGFDCTCLEGYYRLHPSIPYCHDIAECSEDPNPCASQVRTRCKEIPGSFACECHDGFAYNATADECNDIDECDVDGQGPCTDANHICINNDGSFQCQCLDGYTEISGSCADIDECGETGSNACSSEGDRSNCVNTEGSYACDCPSPLVHISADDTCQEIHNCQIVRDSVTNEWKQRSFDPCYAEPNTHCVHTDEPDLYECQCANNFIPFDVSDVTGCVSVSTNFTFNCLDSTSAERVDLDCTCDMSYLDAVTHLHCYPNGTEACKDHTDKNERCSATDDVRCTVGHVSELTTFFCECSYSADYFKDPEEIQMECFSEDLPGVLSEDVIMSLNVPISSFASPFRNLSRHQTILLIINLLLVLILSHELSFLR
ncbi:uncharacterized protein LOC142351989 [Convolutriloba macropyga]|uniref:uncharacterized protein LOC142351989 n=1 Tax=Convolutriloba macropyga TaxID=536237 RepID=UPI003F522681